MPSYPVREEAAREGGGAQRPRADSELISFASGPHPAVLRGRSRHLGGPYEAMRGAAAPQAGRIRRRPSEDLGGPWVQQAQLCARNMCWALALGPEGAETSWGVLRPGLPGRPQGLMLARSRLWGLGAGSPRIRGVGFADSAQLGGWRWRSVCQGAPGDTAPAGPSPCARLPTLSTQAGAVPGAFSFESVYFVNIFVVKEHLHGHSELWEALL